MTSSLCKIEFPLPALSPGRDTDTPILTFAGIREPVNHKVSKVALPLHGKNQEIAPWFGRANLQTHTCLAMHSTASVRRARSPMRLRQPTKNRDRASQRHMAFSSSSANWAKLRRMKLGSRSDHTRSTSKPAFSRCRRKLARVKCVRCLGRSRPYQAEPNHCADKLSKHGQAIKSRAPGRSKERIALRVAMGLGTCSMDAHMVTTSNDAAGLQTVVAHRPKDEARNLLKLAGIGKDARRPVVCLDETSKQFIGEAPTAGPLRLRVPAQRRGEPVHAVRAAACRKRSSTGGERNTVGGEAGIRTRGTLAGTLGFQPSPFGRSGTSPRGRETLRISRWEQPVKPAKTTRNAERGMRNGK